jgi:hypothetical protein
MSIGAFAASDLFWLPDPRFGGPVRQGDEIKSLNVKVYDELRELAERYGYGN